MGLVIISASHNSQATLRIQSSQRVLTFYSPLQHPHANAAQKKDVGTAWGVEGRITWTNPDLRGGTGSAHRVAVVQQNPWRYTEVGWAKLTNGLYTFVTYENGTGPITQYFSNLTPAEHQYTAQYDPNTAKHWYYVDGVSFFSQPVNFSWGDRVIGGGEVIDGIEGMGNTLLFDLRYLVNQGGSFLYVPWDGYERYVEDRPYCNVPNGLNSFYDTECWVYLPILIKGG